MGYEFNGGLSTLSLRKPSQPVKTEAPDAKTLFLHSGENASQYQSFIEAVSDLAQAFKFLPKYDQMKYQYGVPNASADPAIVAEYDAALSEFDYTNDEIFGNFSKQTDPKYANLIWGEGAGRAYSNLEFSPDASDWDLLEGVDSGGSSVLDEINSYFDWDAIKSIGAGQSFYQIAKSGSLSEYSDEQSFNLMCSMTESKERVFSVLYDIFGDSGNLTDDNTVIENISAWLDQYTEVDPHNLGVLKMFFGMQTDFINTIDAYVNCETYWGGDLTSPVLSDELGNFSDTLRTKAESYISTLSGDQKAAAESLESMCFSQAPRYDKVGDKWTGELVGTGGDFSVNTSGSWVEFFQDKMDEFGAKEVVRVITCHIFNRSANQKYKKEKAGYEEKKDDAIQQEIFLRKMQAKNIAANRQTFRKNIARSANVSKAIRTVGRRGASAPARRATISAVRMPAVIRRRASVAGVRAPAAAGRRVPSVSARRAPVISARPSAKVTPKHFVSGPVTRRVSPRVVSAGGQGIKRPAAARPAGHIGARSGGAPAIPSRVRSSSVAPKAQAQAPKHAKDEKKVI